jgi:hypothetical protein
MYQSVHLALFIKNNLLLSGGQPCLPHTMTVRRWTESGSWTEPAACAGGGRAYSAVNALETAGVQRLHEQIEALLAQPMPYNKQELQPPAMTLSHEAKQAWVAFYNQVEAETGPKQTLEPVRSAGTARKAVETLKAHNHLLEPKIPKGEKKPPVTCQSGKKSREWWEVHPESNSSFLAD